MISYGKQSIDDLDINSVVKVLKGDWLTQGPLVENFENKLNDYFGSKYACAVSNGTASLHLSGLALGWGSGDVIITTPITFLATVNSIVYCGATPDFVDIDSETFNINTIELEEKIKSYSSKGQKVKAVIGVDFAGHPSNWKKLRQLADEYDLQLINDNCHALGSSYYDDKNYAVKYADIVTQSYHPVKHITTGEGGAVLTNNKNIFEKVMILRTHGMTKNIDKLEKNDGPWYYELHEIGYNYRITDFQCALGVSQLKKLNFFVERRQKIAAFYDKIFEKNDLIDTPKCMNSIQHSYHLYPIRINFNKTKISKVKFFQKMKEFGINLQVHYYPVHLQPYYKKRYGFSLNQFPIAEEFYKREVSLPIYPELKIKQANYVSECLKNILS